MFPDDDDDSRIEDYLDCTGKTRRFRLQSYARGSFLSATEILDDQACGMRFVMRIDAHGDLPWGEMRDRLRTRLAERDVAVDPKTGELRILRDLVRAHIDCADDEGEGPVLIVDDRRVTWAELGRMFAAHEGWDLRLQILDCFEAQSR